MDILNASSKLMYKALVYGKNHTSTAFLHWSHSQDPSLKVQDSGEWSDITRNIYRATRETKMQALHFRILNRFVPCNAFLKRIRVKGSASCDHCDGEDTILHFFYSCPRVAAFRRSAFAWLDQAEDFHLDTIKEKHFLFGVPQIVPKANTINALFISLKFYIYRQRLFHQGRLELLHWLREFRLRLIVERNICKAQGKPGKFARWKSIMRILE